jgi:hypothetical protein
MVFRITNTLAGSQPIASTSSVQNHPIGKIVTAVDPTLGEGEFIYLKGGASVVANSLVYYTDNAAADSVKLTTTSGVVDGGSNLAVAMAATTAALYGWFQIGGRATVLKTATKIDPASTFKVYLSATAGRVMPTSVAGRQILGARFPATTTVTTTTSTCIVTLNRPTQKTGTLV